MKLNKNKLESFRGAFDEDVRRFAKRIGVSHAWYYGFLNGDETSSARLDTIDRIAKNLGMADPRDLIE